MTEDIDASRRGKREAKVRSRLKSSIARTIAAIGVLNMDAIAPEVAQAISNVRVLLSTWSKRPKLELIADPEVIAGPRSPTDPPKPTVKGAMIRGW